jgi:hypothetical protein
MSAESEIKQVLDSLYETEAYFFYFKQFKHLDRETHELCLLAAPCGGMRCPGGISRTLSEIFQNRSQVRQWLTDVTERVDIRRCLEIAEEWLPEGDYNIPPTFFLLDGYGDAFARDSIVCFDLYSVVLRKRPSNSRYSGVVKDDIRIIEETLAHEYHHIFAGRYLYPEGFNYGEWPENWINYLTCQIVKEGVAMQCNPLSGFKKEIFEDTAVVSYWMTQLAEKFGTMESGTVTGDQISAWYDSTFQESARMLLQRYLQRRFPDEYQEQLVYEYQLYRPMLIYTLGWWMINQIEKGPRGRNGVLEVLRDPHKVFEFYNEALKGLHVDLRFKRQR